MCALILEESFINSKLRKLNYLLIGLQRSHRYDDREEET